MFLPEVEMAGFDPLSPSTPGVEMAGFAKRKYWPTVSRSIPDLLPISGQVVSLAFGGLKGVFVVGYWLHSGSRKGCRRQISKATVRPRGVVVSSPRVELYFSIFDRPEQL